MFTHYFYILLELLSFDSRFLCFFLQSLDLLLVKSQLLFEYFSFLPLLASHLLHFLAL